MEVRTAGLLGGLCCSKGAIVELCRCMFAKRCNMLFTSRRWMRCSSSSIMNISWFERSALTMRERRSPSILSVESTICRWHHWIPLSPKMWPTYLPRLDCRPRWAPDPALCPTSYWAHRTYLPRLARLSRGLSRTWSGVWLASPGRPARPGRLHIKPRTEPQPQLNRNKQRNESEQKVLFSYIIRYLFLIVQRQLFHMCYFRGIIRYLFRAISERSYTACMVDEA